MMYHHLQIPIQLDLGETAGSEGGARRLTKRGTTVAPGVAPSGCWSGSKLRWARGFTLSDNAENWAEQRTKGENLFESNWEKHIDTSPSRAACLIGNCLITSNVGLSPLLLILVLLKVMCFPYG